MRRICTAIALLVAAVTLLAGPAQARPGGHAQTIVFGIQDLDFAVDPATAGCPGDTLFAAGFALVSARGGALGTGVNCVQFEDLGCQFPDLFVGCRNTLRATMLLRLPRGSAAAVVTLHERWLSLSETQGTVGQLFKGSVTGGTGTYDGASGLLVGAGTVTIKSDFSIEPRLLFVLHVRTA